MKHVFVINPNSGKKKKKSLLLENIKEAAENLKLEYEIYFTKGQNDGQRYIRELCDEYALKGQALRIYACGGDGTINEAVNGAFGYDNVEVGAVPLGTGNDFIRNYGTAEDFLDMERQFVGKSRSCDLIKYVAEYKGKVTEGYCANMFNIGFDCNVVDMTDRMKKLPLVSGSLAYLLSVFVILIKKKGANLTVEYSDGSVEGGKILLLAIGNGCYCGGGVKGVPYCETDDGLMDVSMVNDITRSFFIKLFPSYSKGTHMEKPAVKGKGLIKYDKEKAVTVTANEESFRVCIDGEITTQKTLKLSMVQNAFKFIVPAGR